MIKLGELFHLIRWRKGMLLTQACLNSWVGPARLGAFERGYGNGDIPFTITQFARICSNLGLSFNLEIKDKDDTVIYRYGEDTPAKPTAP